METKKCTKCGEERFLSFFIKRSLVCKICINEKARKKRAENPIKYREDAKERRLKNPEKIKLYKKTYLNICVFI